MATKKTNDNPTEALVRRLHAKGIHLELDDRLSVVHATGQVASLDDNDRSLIALHKPVLQVLLKDSPKMQRLAPRTDSRPSARKPDGPRHHSHEGGQRLAVCPMREAAQAVAGVQSGAV